MAHILATGCQIGVCLVIAHCFVRGLWLNLKDLKMWSSGFNNDPDF